MSEHELHYYCKPTVLRPVAHAIEFLTAQEFVADEPACKRLWELIGTQFRTRGKFLAVWPGVRYLAIHRAADGSLDGFLLINAPINWQIDYVVVAAESRGRGIASALVTEAANQALLRGVPYVMLTSKESLRPLYEACGFLPVEIPTLSSATAETRPESAEG
jgi:GNAT superfamily N-acetyltransferase